MRKDFQTIGIGVFFLLVIVMLNAPTIASFLTDLPAIVTGGAIHGVEGVSNEYTNAFIPLIAIVGMIIFSFVLFAPIVEK